MKKNKILYIMVAGLFLTLGACDKFLDTLPDNRLDGDMDAAQLGQLLTSAYPLNGFYYLAEYSSDNVDDNGLLYTPADRMQTQIFSWQDITETAQDSPYAYWEFCYSAIANANAALQTIREQGEPEALAPYKGEALMCRAFNHFMLVNIFSKQYCAATAGTDLGIPYATALETTVSPQYERGTVADVYDSIEKDIVAGLPLIRDDIYSVAKYHFNQKAAYAFAARFYLYYGKYEKAVEYATKALGNNPAGVLRDWSALAALSAYKMNQPTAFTSVSSPANLLLVTSNTDYGALHGPYDFGTRYTHNEKLSASETLDAAGPWRAELNVNSFSNSSIQKVIFRKLGYYFKYNDPVAKTGSPYSIWPAFTTDETLLCRAEAYVLLNDYTNALADFTVFVNAFTKGGRLSEAAINDFYDQLDYYTPNRPTVKKQLDPDFTVAAGQQENFIHCILQLRRALTLHEGLRWFDIKRYGITVYRRVVHQNDYIITDSLTKNDPRRQIQLPQDVIEAGLTANPR